MIVTGEALHGFPRQSPRRALWESDAKDYIQRHFGPTYGEQFTQALAPQFIASDEEEDAYVWADLLNRAVEFLTLLRRRKPRHDDSAAALPTPLTALHPAISDRCTRLFEQGHLVEAVEAGFKVVRGRLRELTGYETASEAFGKGKLHIAGATAAHVDGDFQEAVRFLLMSIDRFRNEKAHVVDGNLTEPSVAYEYLSLASLAVRHLDNANVGDQ